MKKTVSLILSAVCLLSLLSGCGAGSKDTEATAVPAVTTAETADTTAVQTEAETGDTEIAKGTETMLGTFEDQYRNYIFYRNDLHNTIRRLTVDKELKVLFYGGSVTYGVGASDREKTSWRGLISGWLKESFPDASITCTDSSISGTGSLLGLYRLEKDVFPYTPDLIFIEYAVNDYFLKTGSKQIMIQNETMIRRLYEMNPNIDIVYVYTDGIASSAGKDILHSGSAPQDKVAEYYGLNAIVAGRALTDTISDKSSAKSAEWASYYQDGVHPVDAGYAAYFAVLKEFFIREYAAYTDGEVKKQNVPAAAVAGIMEDTTFLVGDDLGNAVTGDWSYVGRASAYADGNVVYKGFMSTNETGKELVYTFTGKGLALFFVGSGIQSIQVAVDGPRWKSCESDGNRPYTVIFDADGEAKEHTVKIRYSASATNFDLRIAGLLVWNR